MREVKNLTIGKVKAGTSAGLKEGQMWAYASVFGNTDSYGDRVMKGAFAKSLEEWNSDDSKTMPFLYGHDMSDPDMNIGSVLKAEEDDRGLKILVEFDEDPKAQKAYRLVKAGRLSQLSFAFDTVKAARIEDPEDPKAYRELQELKLYECSIVPIGANQETEVLAVKSAADAIAAGVKAGRTLSKANEATLREAHAGLVAAAESLKSVLPADEDDTPSGDGKDPKAVGSAPSDADTSSDATPPALGPDEIRGLRALLEGVIPAPSDAKAPEEAASELLVTEVNLLAEMPPSE